MRQPCALFSLGLLALLFGPLDPLADRPAESGTSPRTVRASSWFEPDIPPNPPSNAEFESQPNLASIRVAEAWDDSLGTGQRVAIIDGGFDLNHAAIDGSRVLALYDFLDDDGDPSEVADGLDQDGDGQADDHYGHGTAMASIILWGAPGADVCLYRVLDEEGNGPVQALVDAIYEAVAAGASIINLSLTIDVDSENVGKAIEYAVEAGVAVVAASGNEGGTEPAYPGLYPDTICVGSVDGNDAFPSWATNGPQVDLLAPGVSVVCAYAPSPSGYAYVSGSSVSTAVVSFTVALVKQLHPAWSYAPVRAHLQRSADLVELTPQQLEIGACAYRVDAATAVE